MDLQLLNNKLLYQRINTGLIYIDRSLYSKKKNDAVVTNIPKTLINHAAKELHSSKRIWFNYVHVMHQ